MPRSTASRATGSMSTPFRSTTTRMPSSSDSSPAGRSTRPHTPPITAASSRGRTTRLPRREVASDCLAPCRSRMPAPGRIAHALALDHRPRARRGGRDRRQRSRRWRRARRRGAEVIVVDGGSRDRTAALARPLADHVIGAPRGRAAQMNAGAARRARRHPAVPARRYPPARRRRPPRHRWPCALRARLGTLRRAHHGSLPRLRSWPRR